mgnify:CR=1 FL=1
MDIKRYLSLNHYSLFRICDTNCKRLRARSDTECFSVCSGLKLFDIRTRFENQAYLKLSQNKFKQISVQLQTEHYHLNSPAKVERHAKEILKMEEIINIKIIHHEK